MSNQTTAVVNPPSSPVAQRRPATIKSLLEGDQFKAQVAKALPTHLKPDRFIRVALTTMMRTPKLAQCDQASFFNALLTLSQLGIEPDGRRAHLIPFENRKRGVTECQLIIDYKGLAELAMRSGAVANLHADVVCENDDFEYDRGQLVRHKVDFRKPRGNAYAVYALCRFKDGTEKVEAMSVDEVEDIRNRSRAGNAGPWVTDWREMAKKTVFRRLSKWLPLSAEFHEAADADADDDAIDVPSTVEAKTPSSLVDVIAFDAPEAIEGESDTAEESEAGLAPAPATDPKPASEPKPTETPQERLYNLVTGNGYTFSQFQAWAASGPLKDADSLTGFRDIQTADAERLLKAKPASILAGLKIAKDGGVA